MLVYPGDNGEHLDLANWRRNEWYPALDAAAVEKHLPYAITAGVSPFCLARLMGSSVEQIDRTYGHMLPDSEKYPRDSSTPSTPPARPPQRRPYRG